MCAVCKPLLNYAYNIPKPFDIKLPKNITPLPMLSSLLSIQLYLGCVPSIIDTLINIVNEIMSVWHTMYTSSSNRTLTGCLVTQKWNDHVDDQLLSNKQHSRLFLQLNLSAYYKF